MVFVQFDSVDGAGHAYGYGSEQYLAQITMVDTYIGAIYDCLGSLGRLDDTLFIVVSDHGGTPGGSHGGLTSAEKMIFLWVRGQNIINGTIDNVKNRDVAAIALFALGIEQPEIMTSNVPANLFEGYTATARPLGDSAQKQMLDVIDFMKRYLPTLISVLSQIIGAAAKK